MEREPGSSRQTRFKIILAIPVLVSYMLSAQTEAEMLRPARLLVKVVDANGNPVEGAEVTITHKKRSDYLKKTTTNNRGGFLLIVQAPDLFEDCFLLRIKAEAYRTHERQQLLLPGQRMRAKIVLNPEDPTDYHKRGLAAVLTRDFVAAEALFFAALDLEPNLTESRKALAELYLHLRRYREAIASAENALASSPDNTRMLEVIYESHIALGNLDQAQEAFERLDSLE